MDRYTVTIIIETKKEIGHIVADAVISLKRIEDIKVISTTIK